MKTVWDAVNELKGNLDSMDSISEYLYFTNDWFGDGGRYNTLSINNDKDWQLVGAIRDFGALAAGMETNFGKYTGAKFDASKATKLEVSKVDIDWGEAPEWAKEVGTKDGVMNYWMDDVSYQLFLHDKNARMFFSNYDSSNKSSFLVIATRPQPPVYTQEMCDEDTLPSIGVECLMRKSRDPIDGKSGYVAGEYAGEEVYITAHFETREGLAMAAYFGINKEFGGVACAIAFKPLPPKQELIDGKAYQFSYDAGSNTILDEIDGIYDNNGSEGVLWVKGNAYPIGSCTNITLLTPEEK